MESPAKRSLFGFSGFFRSSTAPPPNSDAKAKSATSAGAAESTRDSGNASAPESPVKRASESQLASRKILGRPQGPSSKLAQSFTAADMESVFSSSLVPSTTGATPRRRPGDNPYKKPAYSSATISHVPAVTAATTSLSRSTNFSGSSTTPRNVFRASSMYQRPPVPSFSPHVPAPSWTQSFPPNTPGRAPRGSIADASKRALSNATSTELFAMRIPSPPRHLTGEMLAKELLDAPKDSGRSGSVYADEYLAHLCPPDLDEHQRRQFFCILDLRRLKYSADEVFTKKDWKMNVMNFAKEFEKNRSLIMLRYGLYEFKTVRASEAVKREWKQKHNIPDSDDESDLAPAIRANVGSKRKAEDDLKSTDTALTSSSSSGNKRARVPDPPAPAPVKQKRKAEAVGEPDENQPAKLLKPDATPQKTPSATKSVFESIVNKTATSTTPIKSPVKSSNLFAPDAAPKQPNGKPGWSVLDATSKPLAAATNIFSHLSDTSKGSPHDDADAESETDSGDGEPESEVQEASPSEEPSGDTSGDAPTPQFGMAKTPATLNGTSSASSDAGEGGQGRSLFDRITRDSDGQPVRQLPSQEGRSPFAISPDKERSMSPAKDLPASAPANNTWNANTPIKFSSGGASLFQSATPKPGAISFGAPAVAKSESTTEPPAAAPMQNLFGGPSKKAEDPATKPDATPKTAPTQPMFGFPAKSTASTSATPSVLFGGSAAPASTVSSVFGSGASVFGQPKEKEEKKVAPTPTTTTPAGGLFGSTPAGPAAATSATSLFGNTAGTKATSTPSTGLFGAPPAASAAEATKPVFQSSTLFGNQTKKESPSQQATSLFGKAASAETPADKPPASNTFGQSNTTPSIFGATTQPSASAAEEPAAKKISFGGDAAKSASSTFGFGTSTTSADTAKPAAPESKPLFGTPNTAPETKSIFGAAGTSSIPQESKSLFGPTTGQSSTTTPMFGTAAAGPIFGSAATPATAPAPSNSIFSFGSTQPSSQPATTQPGGSGSIFGTGGSSSFTFSAGAPDATTINNPFAGGTSSAPSSFTFGSGGNNDSSQPNMFSFGGNATSVPSLSFGGPSDSSTQGSQSNMFAFGGSSSQPNGSSLFAHKPPSTTTSMFGGNLAPGGGGTSTGTNSPFTFGGASSLATTPATGTPEPVVEPEESRGTNADGDEAPQEQISLTEGGPGEEDESVVHEIRAKAVKLVTGGDSEDDDSGSTKDRKKSPWVTQGVGPLRVLKNRTTGAVRMLLRAEPRGNVALNKLVLPNFAYKVEPAGGKYVKLTTATDDGKGLETWMLQVKTAEAARLLAEALETNKKSNAKA